MPVDGLISYAIFAERVEISDLISSVRLRVESYLMRCVVQSGEPYGGLDREGPPGELS